MQNNLCTFFLYFLFQNSKFPNFNENRMPQNTGKTPRDFKTAKTLILSSLILFVVIIYANFAAYAVDRGIFLLEEFIN